VESRREEAVAPKSSCDHDPGPFHVIQDLIEQLGKRAALPCEAPNARHLSRGEHPGETAGVLVRESGVWVRREAVDVKTQAISGFLR
jgi:hypothetical protein